MNSHLHQASASLYYLEGTRLNFFALIIAVATVIALLALRRSQTPDDRDNGKVLGITTTIATLYGIGALIAGVAIAGRELFTSPIDVPIRVEPASLSVSGAVEGSSAVVHGLWLEEITVTVLNLSWSTRILLALGALLSLGVHVILAFLIVTLASRLRDGQPFDSEAVSLSRLSAILVVVCGVGGSYLRRLGTHAVAHEAFSGEHLYSPGLFPDPLIDQFGEYNLRPPEAFEFALPMWPFLVALAIAVLTLLIRQHQSVTAAHARLEVDVSGLV